MLLSITNAYIRSGRIANPPEREYWNIAYGLAPGEAIQDTEGMQTMRTLANNMAWLLKKIHANGTPDYPEREEWQGMNFIR